MNMDSQAGPSPREEDSDEPKKENETFKESMRVSLFFDGTANNRTNVQLGKEGKRPFLGKITSQLAGSYENDYSNIAKLEGCYVKDEQADHSTSIYVEGIGTRDGRSDSLMGLAFGKGGTGVIAKVKKGIGLILMRIKKKIRKKGKQIDYIYLDAFGFSRGAAAARYFIYAAMEDAGKTLKDQLEKDKYTLHQAIEVKFIGLFDTVASYGLKHKNDTEDLHLDSITLADYVLQLAAADEHREKFRLTNIKSSVDESKGCEIFLPGAHSDIGGGYVDGADEGRILFMKLDGLVGVGGTIDDNAERAALKREKKWLIEEGWCTEEKEIEAINDLVYDPQGMVYFRGELRVTRGKIHNTYSLIPMHIMAEFAKVKDVVLDLSRHPIPSALDSVKTEIYGKRPNPGSTGTFLNKAWSPPSEEIKKLRHGYCHLSAYYGTLSNNPQFTKDGPVYGIRERIIQDG